MKKLLLKIKYLWLLRSLFPYLVSKHWHEWRYRRNIRDGKCCRLRICYLDRSTRTFFYPPGMMPELPELGPSDKGFVVSWTIDTRNP